MEPLILLKNLLETFYHQKAVDILHKFFLSKIYILFKMFSKRRPQAKSKNLQTPGTLLYYFKRTKLHYHYLLPPFLPPLLCHACCHLIKRLDFKHLPIGRFFSSAASSLSLKISSNLLNDSQV